MNYDDQIMIEEMLGIDMSRINNDYDSYWDGDATEILNSIGSTELL